MKKLFIITFCLGFSLSCWAQAYKYIDENGNTVFTDTPPQNEAKINSLEAVDISTSQNLIENPENQEEVNTHYMQQMGKDQEQKEQQAQARQELQYKARGNLKHAEMTLEEAQVIQAGDFYPNANSAGGRHTPQYTNRIKEAEKNLDKARKEYQKTR